MTKTLAQIRAELKCADRAQFEALSRALAADERKGVKQALASTKRRLDAWDSEVSRVEGMYAFERSLADGGIVVGLDEVGRGPVAGPLTVAAVILPNQPQILGVNDSKQLSPEKRETLATTIKDVALAWSVEHIEPHHIDTYGMAESLHRAFTHVLAAVEQQGIHADTVLLDGNPLHVDEREKNVVKGDAQCASIAAASIVAKVERDALMRAYALQWPQYGFENNKGYASAEHIAAIKKYGLCPIHRETFCQAWTQETLFSMLR